MLTWFKETVLAYALRRVLEPASIAGYIAMLAVWAQSHGVILTQLQIDNVTQAVLLALSAVAVSLPDAWLTYVPAKLLGKK